MSPHASLGLCECGVYISTYMVLCVYIQNCVHLYGSAWMHMCICVDMRWSLLGLWVICSYLCKHVFGCGWKNVWSVGWWHTCRSMSVWISVALCVCVCVLVCRYLSEMHVMYVDVTTLLEKDFSTHFFSCLSTVWPAEGAQDFLPALEIATKISIKRWPSSENVDY